jgi:DNA replication protein DnaC
MSNLQHERIVALAAELRLGAIAAFYGPIAQAAAKREDASYADFLEEVLRAERDARRVRSREMLTRTAGFPALKTLEAFDFAFATGAPRQQIQELAALGFVERAENVVFLGPSGVGKTQVSTATPGSGPRGRVAEDVCLNEVIADRARPGGWATVSTRARLSRAFQT